MESVRWEGREEFNINPPDALAGSVALVDLCAFTVAGVIVTPSSPGIGRFRCVFSGDSRKLAVVAAGSGRVFTADSAPFRWPTEGGTLDVLCLDICGGAGPLGSFAAVSYRWSMHPVCKE